MKNWTIGRRLFTGVGALITLIVAVAILALWVGRSLEERLISTNDHTVKRLGLVLQIETELERLYATQPALIMAGFMSDKTLVESRKLATAEAIAEVNGSISSFRAEAVTDADRKAIVDLTTDLAGWSRANDQVTTLVTAGNAAEAAKIAIKNGDSFKTQSRTSTDEIVGREQEALQADVEAVKARTASVRLMVFAGVFIALVVAGLAVYSMISANRSLWAQSQELREGTEHVVAAAGQVATSAQGLSQASTHQAASLQETSASMEEMASMTRKNAENAIQAADLATDVARQVRSANEALSDMVGSMTAIRESSNKVAKIIKVIDEIAFQTNILALNAAVEAARAGEAGMGFAVVAGEVRNLAQRSAQAAKDTASLLEESIARSQEGTGRVEQVAQSIASITDNVARVKGMVEEVRQASGQQAQGIDQVTQAIAQMESVTQTTAATAEESAAASEELNAQAEQSMAVVRRLEMLVNGRIANAEAARAGRHARRAEAAPKPKSGQAYHSRHDLGAFGSAEAAFPLTTDVPSSYMKASPAPPAEQEQEQAG
jgi:methyl-accepting chemotaxis protein/methyl-accepting chemotaxis protein-1 (serine sensor receptor)